jgi:hypothetical protein
LIDRVIAIEPDMNMYVQKGIGALIRARLKRLTPCDLDDQKPNQVLARLGSIDGSLSTLDLSAASDSISLSLCREVLPPDWFSAIEHSRSPAGTLPDGRFITYRKVSSMGNGFTFELQSLLFYAAVLTVFDLFPSIGKDRRCRVYGDDIILPTAYAGIFVEFLSWLGFTTNPDKSFVDGPFRESCGKHYFLGDDVTPFYIRENVDKPQKIFWFHNQYILWLRRAEFNRKSLLIMREEFDFLLSIRAPLLHFTSSSFTSLQEKCWRGPLFHLPDLHDRVDPIFLNTTASAAAPHLHRFSTDTFIRSHNGLLKIPHHRRAQQGRP